MLFKSDETGGKNYTHYLFMLHIQCEEFQRFKVEITQTVKTHVISSMMKKKNFISWGMMTKGFDIFFFCQGISRNISETSGLRNFRFTVSMPHIYISPPVTLKIFYLTELFVFRLEQ